MIKKFLLVGCVISNVLFGMKAENKKFIAQSSKTDKFDATAYTISISNKDTKIMKTGMILKNPIAALYWDKKDENVLHILLGNGQRKTIDVSQENSELSV